MDGFEQELMALADGEILNQAMVRLLPESTPVEKGVDLYGLLAFSDKKIVFKHFANHNWLSTLMAGSSDTMRDDKEITLVIDRGNVQELTRSAPEGFWQRLFGGNEPTYTLLYRDETSRDTATLLLTVVHAQSGEKRFFEELSS
jgi:hypothetical protein